MGVNKRRNKILAIVLAATLAAGPAMSQVRIQPMVLPPVAKRLLPPTIMIKPSQALRIALQNAPSAQALGVQLRGPHYIVKLKQGNKIMQFRVNAADGSVQ